MHTNNKGEGYKERNERGDTNKDRDISKQRKKDTCADIKKYISEKEETQKQIGRYQCGEGEIAM